MIYDNMTARFLGVARPSVKATKARACSQPWIAWRTQTLHLKSVAGCRLYHGAGLPLLLTLTVRSVSTYWGTGTSILISRSTYIVLVSRTYPGIYLPP